jgi:hypothetical protein
MHKIFDHYVENLLIVHGKQLSISSIQNPDLVGTKFLTHYVENLLIVHGKELVVNCDENTGFLDTKS